MLYLQTKLYIILLNIYQKKQNQNLKNVITKILYKIYIQQQKLWNKNMKHSHDILTSDFYNSIDKANSFNEIKFEYDEMIGKLEI